MAGTILMRRQIFIACMAVLTLQSSASCIDWDRLRAESDASMGRDGSADTSSDSDVGLGDPVVAWRFAQLADDVVADMAPRAPNLPLLLHRTEADGEEPVVEGNALWLRNNALKATPTAAKELGDVIALAGGGLTFEVWIRGTVLEDGSSLLLGFPSGAFSMLVRDGAVWIELRTSVGLIDVKYPETKSLTEDWHHLAFTYQPGVSLVTVYFDGAKVVHAQDEVPDSNSRLVFVSPEDEADPELLFNTGEQVNLRLNAAAIFARELTAEEVKRRHSLGLSRL